LEGGGFTAGVIDLRINERIRHKQVRLINDEGQQVRVGPIEQARVVAREAGLDLVEVAPDVDPPVCRVMDYGKYKYRMKKRQHSKVHSVHIKEVRLRPKTEEHDLEVKLRRAREFLKKKDKVLINMVFRGREMRHTELGHHLMEEVKKRLEEVAKVEKGPTMEGRRITMTLAPKD